MSLSVSTTPANLTRYLSETPATVEKSLTRKETLYSAAMKISAVAAVVFFAIPIFTAAGLIGTSWIGIPTALGCVIAAMICTKGHVAFEKRMQEAQLQKSFYARLSDKVSKEIKPGETKGIDEFFKKHKGSIEQIPQTTLAALTKINPTAPLDALKPLIIRYEEADILPYGIQVTLQKVLIAATLLSKSHTKENTERCKKLALKEATMFRLAPYYAKQRKECAAMLGLKG